MEIIGGFLPFAAVDKVIPVGDLIVDRAAVVAIGNAAVHAARRLLPDLRLGKRDDKFFPVPQALFDRPILPIGAIDFQKPGRLSHLVSVSRPTGALRRRPTRINSPKTSLSMSETS